MKLYDKELPVIYLKPGEIYFAEKPALVTTVLGSCVSVTMFNRSLEIGAICHGFLPVCKDNESCCSTCMAGFRYVDCSIRRMILEFNRLGIRNNEIEVKLFGGADLFESGNKGRRIITVGEQNIETAIKIVKAENLILHKSDVGGELGRRIFFYTHTGEVLVKRLRETEIDLSSE